MTKLAIHIQNITKLAIHIQKELTSGNNYGTVKYIQLLKGGWWPEWGTFFPQRIQAKMA